MSATATATGTAQVRASCGAREPTIGPPSTSQHEPCLRGGARSRARGPGRVRPRGRLWFGHRPAHGRRPRRARRGDRRRAGLCRAHPPARAGRGVRVGDLQFLPYEDGEFDVVLGFNSFQYAADVPAALREARRVLRDGGCLGILAWGPGEQCELAPYLAAVGSVLPPPAPGAPGPFRLSEPGVLRGLVEEAGFDAAVVADAAAAFVYPDEPTALRRLLSAGPCVTAIAHAGEGAVPTPSSKARALSPRGRLYAFEKSSRSPSAAGQPGELSQGSRRAGASRVPAGCRARACRRARRRGGRGRAGPSPARRRARRCRRR